MLLEFSPAVNCTENHACKEQEYREDESDWNPFRRRGYAIFGFCRGRDGVFPASEIVFSKEIFFPKAEIASDAANETAAKDSAGQSFPIFILKRLERTLADSGRFGHFFE